MQQRSPRVVHPNPQCVAVVRLVSSSSCASINCCRLRELLNHLPSKHCNFPGLTARVFEPMAATFSAVGTVNSLSFNNLSNGSSVPSSAFFGSSVKNVSSKFTNPMVASGSFRIAAEIDEDKQTDKDRWKGLAYDVSDDQQDITRGKGMVDSLFQAPMDAGTHYAVLSSYEYLSQGLREYSLDNNMTASTLRPRSWISSWFTSPRTS